MGHVPGNATAPIPSSAGRVLDMLLEYSEWLDADQHLMYGDGGAVGQPDSVPNREPDTRTHAELVRDFMAQRRKP